LRYLDDILIAIGLILIGASVYLVAGWPGLIGYLGALCAVGGVMLGWQLPMERKP
jgi:hypothetical protein